MAAKLTPEEIEQAHAQIALDRAWALREEYNTFLERRRANRDELRGKLTQGVLDEDQARQVIELYPDRKRGEDEEDELTGEPVADPQAA